MELDRARGVGGDGDPQPDAADLLDLDARRPGEAGEGDHVAVGIGVVLHHVDDPVPPRQIVTSSRTAIGGRLSVSALDVDADDRRSLSLPSIIA